MCSLRVDLHALDDCIQSSKTFLKATKWVDCMCVCMHTYVCTYICKCVCACVYTHISVCLCSRCSCVCTCVSAHSSTYSMHIYVHLMLHLPFLPVRAETALPQALLQSSGPSGEEPNAAPSHSRCGQWPVPSDVWGSNLPFCPEGARGVGFIQWGHRPAGLCVSVHNCTTVNPQLSEPHWSNATNILFG